MLPLPRIDVTSIYGCTQFASDRQGELIATANCYAIRVDVNTVDEQALLNDAFRRVWFLHDSEFTRNAAWTRHLSKSRLGAAEG
jgi:hypothetical protein